jgi:electron transfer flavoprotein beta subunit
MDPEQYFLTPKDIIYRVNPYDEAALELALKAKARLDDVEIILLTLGPVIAEAELRRCLALGADDLYRIETDRELDPWSKSGLLARAIKDIGADLILCGKESLDGQSGQVGALTAHHLDVPFLSAVVDLTIEDKKRAKARRAADRGVREVIECRLPAVFSVEMGYSEPPLPTYEAKKRTRSTEIKTLSYTDEILNNKTITTRVFSPRPRPKKTPAPDSEAGAFYRIEQLLTESRIEKKGTILEGDPESQVNGILFFLEEHGFIDKKDSKKE